MLKKGKNYTDLQRAFLDALFDPVHKGNIRKAMNAAGYSSNTLVSEVINALRDEIVDASKAILALHAPAASHQLGDILVDPDKLGAGNIIKAANSILDRIVSKPEDGSLTVKTEGDAYIILPAKRKSDDFTTEETL